MVKKKLKFSVDGLRAAITHSKRYLRPHNERRREMVRAYRGSEYGGYDSDDIRPQYLQLMTQAVDAYVQTLAANRPRVLVSTDYPELVWFAKLYGRALNRHIAEIALEQELRMVVLEACLSPIGIMKIYYGGDSDQYIDVTDNRVDPGMPYAEHIALPDFGYDVRASSWRKIQFAYDEYWMDMEVLLEEFPKAKESIRGGATRSEMINREGDTNDQGDYESDFLPQRRVRDVWIPSTNQIVRMLADCDEQVASDLTILDVIDDWEGPKTGPYRILTFADNPDMVLGISPASRLLGLHSVINSLFRKQINQARRQRDIPIYEEGAEQDVRNIMSAEDGRWTKVRDREKVDVLKMGGVDPGNLNFGLGALQHFDRMAGNLPAIAGLGPNAPTLGQDEIIQEQASKLISKMQYRVVEFTESVMKDLGWLLWNDKVRDIQIRYTIPGTDMETTTTWTPEHREGRFTNYNFTLEPYSMAYKSPSQRAQALLSFVRDFAIPLGEMFGQQGGQVDLKQFTEYWSELNDLPRLNTCIKWGTGPPTLAPMQPPPRPSQTTRTHVRRDIGAAGPNQNPNQQVMDQLQEAAAKQQLAGARDGRRT